jgi:hypothetical protein
MARCFISRFARLASCLGMGLLLLIVVLQAGCKRSTEKPTTFVGPRGERATVTKDGDDTELAYKGIHGEDIRSATGKKGVALPANFPADVAVYPKATIAMAVTTDKEITVILSTTDSIQKVGAFYKGKLKDKGWKSNMASDAPQLSMLEGEKEGRKLVVFMIEKPEGTSIQLVVSNKK